ncbi:MAG: O-antigen ligase family protein [Caldilineaceae bacterium]
MLLRETWPDWGAPARHLWLLLGAILGAAALIGLLAAYKLILAFAVVLLSIGAFCMIAQPGMATLIVVWGLYTNAAVIAVKFHHMPFVVGAAFPMLLVIPLIHYIYIQRRPFIITPVFLLLIVYLLIQILGTIFTTKGIELALPELMTFVIEGIVLSFLVANTVRTPEILRRAIWMLLLAGLFMGSLSFYQQITHTFNNNYGGFAQNDDQGDTPGVVTAADDTALHRMAGPVGEKNRYAQIMMMLVPLGLFRFWGERSRWLQLLALACTGFALIGAALSFSRGGMVGLALMLAIMVAMRYIKIKQLVIVGIGLLLVLSMFPQLTARLASLKTLTALFSDDQSGINQSDNAIRGRATEMLAAGMVFADHPLIGVGPGMFPYYVEEYAKRIGIRGITTTREAHILYLGIAADYGVLGLICFLAMLFITLRDLMRARKKWMHTRPELANLAASFMFSIIIYMTTGLFLHMSYQRYFWLMLALAGAASYVANNPISDEPAPAKGKPLVKPTLSTLT